MRLNYGKKRIFSLMTAVFMLICMNISVLAADELFFVSDDADILSDKFEQDVKKRGEALYELTGCQIAVVTVDFMGGEEIESFSEQLFLRENIGAGENRGLLLLFCIGEEHYRAVAGQGMSGILPRDELQKLLDKSCEPYFADGDYAAAVEKSYYEVIELLEQHFDVSTDEGDFLLYQQQLENERLAEQRERKITFGALIAVGIVTLLLFVRFAIVLKSSLKRRAIRKRRIF